MSEGVDILSDVQGDESALWGLQGDGEWRNAWSRIIAFAWMSEENLIQAVEKPVETMFEVSGYVPPAGLFIRIRATIKQGDELKEIITDEYPKTQYVIKDGELFSKVVAAEPQKPSDYQYDESDIGNKVNGWNDLETNLPTDIVLTLPPRPQSVAANSFALADYQATGKTFPFTC